MERKVAFKTAFPLAVVGLCIWTLLVPDWPGGKLHGQNKGSGGTSGAQVLPVPDPPFKGVIGPKASVSKPDFPRQVSAPKGAPNILLIMTDDTGFGASSAFGGPIPTPTLERIANNGLRFNNFHTTALCSPTRAALLTGRNHHSVGFGNITEFASGYPGYDSILPRVPPRSATFWWATATTLPGSASIIWYQTGCKVPMGPSTSGLRGWASNISMDSSAAIPITGIPRFLDTKPVLPPAHDPNYILIRDMADRAIDWIHMQHAISPEKPFLMSSHRETAMPRIMPPKTGLRSSRVSSDVGWDRQREMTLENQKRLGIVPQDTVLTDRPKDIPAWNTLSADQKKVYARMMEVYAAAVAQSDYEIGRVVDSLEESGQLDNTMVVYIEGDNGASGEGTLEGLTNELGGNLEKESLAFKLSMLDELGSDRTYNHYPVGWAHAMDTPFQWTKQVASHFGGTANGLAISWPKRIKALWADSFPIPTRYRHCPHHPGSRRHSTPHRRQRRPAEAVRWRQHCVHLRQRQRPHSPSNAIFRDHRQSRHVPRWLDRQHHALAAALGGHGRGTRPDDFPWELYHVTTDFSQAKNLAKQNPQKLKELQTLFMSEAAKFNVLPIDSSFADRADPRCVRGSTLAARSSLTTPA